MFNYCFTSTKLDMFLEAIEPEAIGPEAQRSTPWAAIGGGIGAVILLVIIIVFLIVFFGLPKR